MIKQIMITVGFILGIITSAYLLTSLIEWNIDISEWSRLGRFALIMLTAGIFQVFTKLGRSFKG